MSGKKGQIHKPWTMAELKELRKHLHLTDKELGLMFGRPKTAVEAARMRYGMVKPKQQWNWQKGHEPYNKGMKGQTWISANKIENVKRTQFKKGQTPANAFRQIGDVFTIIDATKKPYRFIKLAHHRQYPYGRYVWEQYRGEKLTKNEMIRFKDGDPLNCDISNLAKVTRAENARLNTNREKAGKELKKTWAVVKTFEDFGLTPPYKFRSKKKSA